MDQAKKEMGVLSPTRVYWLQNGFHKPMAIFAWLEPRDFSSQTGSRSLSQSFSRIRPMDDIGREPAKRNERKASKSEEGLASPCGIKNAGQAFDYNSLLKSPFWTFSTT